MSNVHTFSLLSLLWPGLGAAASVEGEFLEKKSEFDEEKPN